MPPALLPYRQATEALWPLSVERYHAMIAAGILTPDDPVELLEGVLVFKMPKKPRHRLVTGLLMDVLTRLLPMGWFLEVQEPVTTPDSEPEPDLKLIRGMRMDYRTRHPGPNDVGLVVEVSESTLRRDQTTKLRVYARAGVPIYWIVNLLDNCVEVHSDPHTPSDAPDSPSYRTVVHFRVGEAVPVLLEGREIGRVAVSDILPPTEPAPSAP